MVGSSGITGALFALALPPDPGPAKNGPGPAPVTPGAGALTSPPQARYCSTPKVGLDLDLWTRQREHRPLTAEIVLSVLRGCTQLKEPTPYDKPDDTPDVKKTKLVMYALGNMDDPFQAGMLASASDTDKSLRPYIDTAFQATAGRLIQKHAIALANGKINAEGYHAVAYAVASKMLPRDGNDQPNMGAIKAFTEFLETPQGKADFIADPTGTTQRWLQQRSEGNTSSPTDQKFAKLTTEDEGVGTDTLRREAAAKKKAQAKADADAELRAHGRKVDLRRAQELALAEHGIIEYDKKEAVKAEFKKSLG